MKIWITCDWAGTQNSSPPHLAAKTEVRQAARYYGKKNDFGCMDQKREFFPYIKHSMRNSFLNQEKA